MPLVEPATGVTFAKRLAWMATTQTVSAAKASPMATGQRLRFRHQRAACKRGNGHQHHSPT